MTEIPGPESISTRLQRIAERAREAPEMAFTSLNHHLDLELLREAYRRTRKDAATGVDGQTAASYAENLEGNLRDLLERAKSGRYQAPPLRRAYIPKGDGKLRPLGMPTFEDKVLQRAVTMILVAVYEQDFLDCSYGFRPGRSAHQALEALWHGLMAQRGGWIIDADIQGYYDAIDHGQLRSFLDRRIRDGVLRKLIDKWLKAGVLEEGRLWHPETGTPQGGVVSPILANIYLHEVLDTWFNREVVPRLQGEAFLVRYADDFVIVCAREEDARRVLEVLPKRFGKYRLTLHPAKTKLVPFTKPPLGPDGKAKGKGPATFDLLGFTHYWGSDRNGRWIVKRKTAAQRMNRVLERLWKWCDKHRHWRVKQQHEALCRSLRGHYAYYGITGNIKSLQQVLHRTRRIWKRWLGRRSQRAYMSWKRFDRLSTRYPLPPARIVHSYRQA